MFRISYDKSVKLKDSFNPLLFRSHAAANSNTAQQMKFSFRVFFSRFEFTTEILNGKLHFWCIIIQICFNSFLLPQKMFWRLYWGTAKMCKKFTVVFSQNKYYVIAWGKYGWTIRSRLTYRKKKQIRLKGIDSLNKNGNMGIWGYYHR